MSRSPQTLSLSCSQVWCQVSSELAVGAGEQNACVVRDTQNQLLMLWVVTPRRLQSWVGGRVKIWQQEKASGRAITEMHWKRNTVKKTACSCEHRWSPLHSSHTTDTAPTITAWNVSVQSQTTLSYQLLWPSHRCLITESHVFLPSPPQHVQIKLVQLQIVLFRMLDFRQCFCGSAEMAQRLRTLAAHTGDPGSSPTTNLEQFRTVYNSTSKRSRDCMPVSGLCRCKAC